MWHHGVLCCDWLHCMMGGMMPCLYLGGGALQQARGGSLQLACCFICWLISCCTPIGAVLTFWAAPSPSGIGISSSLPYLSLCGSDFLPSATGWPTAGCSSSSSASYWSGAVPRLPPNTSKAGRKISLWTDCGDAGFSDGQRQISSSTGVHRSSARLNGSPQDA